MSDSNFERPNSFTVRYSVYLQFEHSIFDLTGYVDYLFNDGSPHPCDEHMDINHDGINGISDLTYYVDYMFNNGSVPDACE